MIRPVATPGDLHGAHMVFFGAAAPHLAELLAATRGRPMLIASEAAAGMPSWSAINFVIVGERLRFDVSLGAAQQRGLKLSARLLSAARDVKPGPAKDGSELHGPVYAGMPVSRVNAAG